MLKKEFKYVPPEGAADETPGEDGLTDSAIDFNWERDVENKVRRVQVEERIRRLMMCGCRCSK